MEKSKAGDNSKNGVQNKRNEKNHIQSVTNYFLRDIRGLQFAQTEISKVLITTIEGHAKELATFIEVLRPVDNANPNAKSEGQKFLVPVDKVGELEQRLHQLSVSTSSLPLSYRGLFLVLISKWDAFFGAVLKWIYRTKPETIDSSNRTITFAELKEIDSIDNARIKIIDNEVNSILRESHSDQFAYLEKKLGISLRKVDVWPSFVEITQRRNLIAHTDGKISQQYIQVCREHNVALNAKISLGVELDVTPTYFNEACDCLAEIGFKLSQVIWRKLEPNQKKKASSHLIETTFEMIKANQNKLAIRLLEFSLTHPMGFEVARDRYLCIINLAQSYKWSGDQTKCLKIIDAEDWSAASIDFQLAAAVLKDQFPEAGKLMVKIGTSGDIRKENYQEWPLFKKFRNSSKFLEAYRAVFGTENDVRDIQPELAPAFAIEDASNNEDSSATKKTGRQTASPKPSQSKQKASSRKPRKNITERERRNN